MLGKRLINSNSAAAGGSCTTDTLQILGDTSCIAYYKMSDATDESGSYDGTPTSVNFNVAGKFGNAGSFNGSNSNITLPTSLPTAFGANNFTISYWINLSSRSASNVDAHFSIQDPYFFYIYSNINSGNIQFVIRTGGSNSNVDTGDVLPLNSWNNIVFVKSSTGNGVSIYLNGTEIYTTTSYTGDLNSGQFGVNNIGTYGNSALYAMNGKIDQVRIFNKALLSTEVTTLNNEVYCVPTIVPTDHFSTVTYTGTNNTQSTNSLSNQSGTLSFQPDFIWFKNRTGAYLHQLYNSIRGANLFLNTGVGSIGSRTGAEPEFADGGTDLTSFNSSGFTVGTAGFGSVNDIDSLVAWCWYAPTAETNNAGSNGATIASTIKKNIAAGFSIVTYGGSTSGATVKHGLSITPEVIIIKCTSTASTNWISYHQSLGDDHYLTLNSTIAKANSTDWLQPNSTTFALNQTFGNANTSGRDYVAYAFHSVDGYSKFGSYTGTGSTGNTIVTGFRPAFLMIKSTGVESWYMMDNRRLNGVYANQLYANLNNTEGSGQHVDFTSNGFRLDTTDGGVNNGSASYIFMAFAEEVFNPSGVTRNATNPFGDGSEIALYKFEDDATDAEGNFSATLSSVTYATGYIDKAASFNGSSNRKVDLPNLGIDAAKTRTISAWINTNSLSATQTIFQYGTNAAKSRFGFSIDTAGKLYIEYFGRDIITSSNQITNGSWFHVAVTYNGGAIETATNTQIYVNGSAVGISSSGTSTGSATTGNANYAIGSDRVNTRQYFNGLIDQVRIFNRALDSGEVLQLYNE